MAELRKAGEPVNDGERRVLQALRDGLSKQWVVISNLHLRLSAGMVLEIDAVVIGRDGLWALEFKDWQGKIIGDDLHWRLADGSLRESPLSSIELKAKKLHSFLDAYPNVSKVGLVVIANDEAQLCWPKSERKAVLLLSEVVSALKSGKYVFGQHSVKLERDHIQRLANELFKARTEAPPQQAGHYVLDLQLNQTETYTDYRAHHALLPQRLVRLKRFELTDVLAPLAGRAEQRRLFMRDMEALVVLESGRHPSLPVVYDFFVDQDSDAVFWMVEEWQEGKTLHDMLAEERNPLATHLDIVRQLGDALDFCHSRGVIHRNLNSKNVMVLADGKIKLLNFDYARVTGRRTVSGGKQPPANPYIAPEYSRNPTTADHRVDLYSLGVLWSQMLTGKPISVPSQLSRGANVPAQVRSVVEQLLSPAPCNRPKDAKTVLALLDRIGE